MEIVSSLLIWVGVLVVAGGWLGWIWSLLFRTSSSLMPFIGAIFCIVGVYLHPDQQLFNQWKPWVWLVLVVDLGSLPMLLMVVFGGGSRK